MSKKGRDNQTFDLWIIFLCNIDKVRRFLIEQSVFSVQEANNLVQTGEDIYVGSGPLSIIEDYQRQLHYLGCTTETKQNSTSDTLTLNPITKPSSRRSRYMTDYSYNNGLQKYKQDCSAALDEINTNKKRVNKIKSDIATAGDGAISHIRGMMFGFGPVMPGTLKDCLTNLNADYTSTFEGTANAIDCLNDNVAKTLTLIQGLLFINAKIIQETNRNKKESTKTKYQLDNIIDQIENGQITIDEIIDLVTTNAKEENERLDRIEEKLLLYKNKSNKFIRIIDGVYFKIALFVISLFALIASLIVLLGH